MVNYLTENPIWKLPRYIENDFVYASQLCVYTKVPRARMLCAPQLIKPDRTVTVGGAGSAIADDMFINCKRCTKVSRQIHNSLTSANIGLIACFRVIYAPHTNHHQHHAIAKAKWNDRGVAINVSEASQAQLVPKQYYPKYVYSVSKAQQWFNVQLKWR